MWLKSVVDFISKPFAEVVGGWQARKTMETETETFKIKSDLELKSAMNQAIVNRIQQADNNDFLLDLKAQENRKSSFMDEILQLYWIVIITMHFIPFTQPYMLEGWEVLSQAPDWFTIGIIIIMVTTMGGMRILRLFVENANLKGMLGIKR